MKKRISNVPFLFTAILLFVMMNSCKKEDLTAAIQNSNTQFNSIATAAIPERKTLVYVGITDEGDGSLMAQQSDPANYSKWEYVRTKADGYYENFITMAANNQTSDPMGNLKKMAAAYTNKNCFFETSLETSTNGHPNNETTDKQSIDLLSNAGFNVNNTSLNYGITAQRVNTLRTYRYERACLTLGGPWTFGGDINGNNPGTNATYRKNILATDGIALDGPMSKWSNNDGDIREGTYSAIQFAHDNGKRAAMMVAPSPFFGDPKYNPYKDYLKVSKQCVMECEANNAAPDQWHVWTYQSVGVPIFPENITLANGQIGVPNTLMGVAYWLIKHVNNLPVPRIPNTGQVNSFTTVNIVNSTSANVSIKTFKDSANAYTMPIQLLNTPDPQIEISPVFATTINGNTADWKVSFTVDSLGTTKDITNDVLHNGFNCVGNWVITHARKFRMNMHLQALKESAQPITVNFTIVSNRGNTGNKSYYTVVAKTIQ